MDGGGTFLRACDRKTSQVCDPIRIRVKNQGA